MKLNSRGVLIVLVVTALALGGGCVSDQTRRLEAENRRLERANRDLAAEFADLQARGGEAQRGLEQADALLTKKDQEIGMLNDQVAFLTEELSKAPVPESALPPELARALDMLKQQGTLIEMREGARVRLKGDVLFASGKADIKPEAAAQLDSLAKVIIEKGALFAVRVDGHTDSDPISKTKHLWKDNWDLACGRAQAVLKALVGAGVPEERIFIAGFGQFSPREPNDSAANKQKNRRVELVLMPEKR